MTWHVIHTKPRQETRAVENLARQGFRCYLPTFKAERVRRGQIYICIEPLFPRYLFIYSDNALNWNAIRSTKGVQAPVSFGGEIAKVGDELINALQKVENNLKAGEPDKLFNQGEKVQITTGPFSGLEAIYQMSDGESRALVLLEFLGKPTQAKFDIMHLKKTS
ncbi:MAG: transcription/translation regulatory transformer protein RfaH [Methylicorpusculum sp.]|uniref:transcription/translation regulatory transformer protein RfaH n=1 Tax=Methylicorpusculum sp. TaxID=2713644 RepID=UPI00271E218C|nr:transcription/translation regulatory transformer protein RfaH [Methylicorpusculum sp.]MDO8845695.1 transcription/translation regulatory transformer protein RfaH [Methylicorpusculum sp.]MDO8938764.1 transcription/translation regulatory transformer protein RfaH [Methylicorpusculum sp.]MDP2176995.1 transcription/translation regulatory transformer protein RfaH [Methylicorpusculum sp.]MDP2201236.1 transcription/translation regulatory transformer protein RfaH [Methylicorpusculum sp.]MDP3527812.1 